MKCEFSQKRNKVDKMAMIRNRYNRTPHSRNQTRNRPAHEIMVLITQATSEGSGEPAHPHSLTTAIAVCIHEVWK